MRHEYINSVNAKTSKSHNMHQTILLFMRHIFPSILHRKSFQRKLNIEKLKILLVNTANYAWNIVIPISIESSVFFLLVFACILLCNSDNFFKNALHIKFGFVDFKLRLCIKDHAEMGKKTKKKLNSLVKNTELL